MTSRSEIDKTQSAVMGVYRKVNPSYFPVEDDETVRITRLNYMRNLFERRLSFPTRMFRGSHILDIGCGTGENSSAYLEWGATGKFLDSNPDAICRASELFNKFYPNSAWELCNKSIFDFCSTESFEIVTSIGVIHHTEAPDLAFRKVANFVRLAGFLFVGVCSPAGFFQRNLQRILVNSYSTSEKEVVDNAEYFFSEHINRAEKLGGRQRNSIIYDTYVNPKIKGMTTREILTLAAECGLRLFSAHPQPFLSFICNSPNVEIPDLTELTDFVEMNEDLWSLANREDRETMADYLVRTNSFERTSAKVYDLANDVPGDVSQIVGQLVELTNSRITFRQERVLAEFSQDFSLFWLEVHNLLTAIDKKLNRKDVRNAITNYRFLFKGLCGLGQNFWAFQREANI